MIPAHRQSRGFALILVVTVIGLAAVLGYAMLASASTSAQIEKNMSSGVQAESLAESGVNLAMYYLNYPQFAPTINAAGHWPGGTNVSIGSTKIDEVSVTQLTGNVYEITSRASVGGITHTSAAQVEVESVFQINHVLLANGELDFRETVFPGNAIIGKARAWGLVKTAVAITAATIEALGADTSAWTPAPAYASRPVPSLSEIKMIASLPYYRYNGRTYVAKELTSDISGTLPSPGASNPANVYYTKNTRKFSGTTTLNGTLIVLGNSSDLEVSGTLTVTPKAGMPAIITERRLRLTANTAALTAHGLVWVGDRLESASASLISALLGLFQRSKLTINGSLMMASMNSDAVKDYRGELDLEYVANNVAIPDFSAHGVVPQSVKILSWK